MTIFLLLIWQRIAADCGPISNYAKAPRDLFASGAAIEFKSSTYVGNLK